MCCGGNARAPAPGWASLPEDNKALILIVLSMTVNWCVVVQACFWSKMKCIINTQTCTYQLEERIRLIPPTSTAGRANVTGCPLSLQPAFALLESWAVLNGMIERSFREGEAFLHVNHPRVKRTTLQSRPGAAGG